MTQRALRRSNEVAKHLHEATDTKHEQKKVNKGPVSNKRKRDENKPGR